jgi:hypothetical protein
MWPISLDGQYLTVVCFVLFYVLCPMWPISLDGQSLTVVCFVLFYVLCTMWPISLDGQYLTVVCFVYTRHRTTQSKQQSKIDHLEI